LEFERRYKEFGIRTVRATGDFTDDNEALMAGRYDICLTTYEKATALAIVAPHLLDGVGTVVLDDAQALADRHRGAGLEFLMTMLRVEWAGMTVLIALSEAHAWLHVPRRGAQMDLASRRRAEPSRGRIPADRRRASQSPRTSGLCSGGGGSETNLRWSVLLGR
jgi:hypothetical protein